MFDASKCDRCGDCFVRCQYVDYSQEKAIEEITALMEGKDAEILSECVTCVACNEYCPKGANPYDLICQLQEEKDILPVPEATIKWMDDAILMPSEIFRGAPERPGLSLCAMERYFPAGSFDGQMFEGLTVVKGGEYFCNIGYLHAARESVAKRKAQDFVDQMAGVGVDEFVIPHADCYAMLTTKAEEYGIKVPFKVVHIFEYMLGYLKDHRDGIARLNRKIAYQRPCASRWATEVEPVLDEIFELIGVERVARRYDRQDALCCGGMLIRKNRDRALQIQDMNLTDAHAHEAEAMVFLCPYCYFALERSCQERGLVPIFITHLCRMALGELPFS